MVELATIKGHGLAVGDTVDFYGMAGKDTVPSERPTRVKVGKVGNKYMLTSVAGEVITWEFGATAKIWAAPIVKAEAEATCVHCGNATVGRDDQVSPFPHECVTAEELATFKAMMASVDTEQVSLSIQVTPEAVAMLAERQAEIMSDRAAEAIMGLVTLDMELMNMSAADFADRIDDDYANTANEPATVTEADLLSVVATIFQEVKVWSGSMGLDVEAVRAAERAGLIFEYDEYFTVTEKGRLLMEAEVWADTDTLITVKAPIRTLLGRRKRKATRKARKAMRGGF